MSYTYTIDKVCDIQTGYHFRGKVPHFPMGDIQVLQPANLKDGELVEPLSSVLEADIKSDIERYKVTVSDVILPNKGTDLRPARLEEDKGVFVATSSLFILRPGPYLLTEFLLWILGQEIVQEYLKKNLSGSTVPNLTKKVLGRLEIPVPNRRVQHRIVEAQQVVREEERLLNQLIRARASWLSSYGWEQIQQNA